MKLRQVNLESNLNPDYSHSPSPKPLTHIEEQRALRDETIAAFHPSVGNDGADDTDDLLVLREKTRDEVEKEEEEYRAFLETQVGTNLEDLVTVDSSTIWEPHTEKKKRKKLEAKKEVSTITKEQDNQQFLMEYGPPLEIIYSS